MFPEHKVMKPEEYIFFNLRIDNIFNKSNELSYIAWYLLWFYTEQLIWHLA